MLQDRERDAVGGITWFQWLQLGTISNYVTNQSKSQNLNLINYIV